MFVDASRAARNLKALHEAFLTSGSTHSLDDFAEAVDAHLARSPDPDMALNNLLRFVEATMSKAALFNDLVEYPVLMEVLTRVFGHSQYFADILVRDPELFRWLTATDSLTKARSKHTLAAEVTRTLELFGKPEKRLDGLKRFYRREILRAGTRDILGEADLSTVTRELSDLADVLVDGTVRIAQTQLAERYGEPPRTPFAVIGLGKLGGGELNYSSDIDILFVYGDEGSFPHGRRKITHHEYFNALAEKVVQNLSQPSNEGHLYRVDTRLRPESGAGPLARSLVSYLTYYETRGELWERQMLIKARPVAGDVELGRQFIEKLVPFVYPRTFFQHPAESIARIKARIEQAIEGEENVKLRPGGIRDIEFVVQALQLVNGGKHKDIREPNTMRAIDRLAEVGFLSRNERETLAAAYVFLRSLEHKLQTMFNTQTHAYPTDPQVRSTLARRLGFGTFEELDRLYRSHLQEVRRVYSSVLSVAEEGTKDIESVIDGGLRRETVERVLASYNIRETTRAARNLSQLVTGSSLGGTRDLDNRAREAFRLIARPLFEAIASTPLPDLTFNNLTQVLASQKMPEHLYRQLQHEGVRKLLVAVCAISPRFAAALARDSQLLEMVITNPSQQVDLPADDRELSQYKARCEVLTGVRNLLGITDFDTMTTELTTVADGVLSKVLERETLRTGVKSARVAVLALGKYGTGEITFDSDLDVVFITDAASSARAALEKAVASSIQRLSSVSEKGKLYDVDARLRPEGRSSPLLVERRAYLKYLAERASLWERQSLTRVRCVAGNVEFGKAVLGAIQAYVYDTPLPLGWTWSMVDMRRKIETRSRTRARTFHDIKLGAGGMVDVEFVAQMLQLSSGVTEMRHLRTVDALNRSSTLYPEEATALGSAYRTYRELEKLMRITLEDRGTVLPEGGRLDMLARCLGHPSGAELQNHIAKLMHETRKRFLSIAQRVAAAG